MKMLKYVATILLIVLLTSNHSIAQEQFELKNNNSSSVDTVILSNMINKINSDKIDIHSFLILNNDNLVYEKYFDNYTRDSLHILYSATKTVTGILTGIAIDKGYINNVDQKLIDLIPDWIPDNCDSNLLKITVKHLLTLSTGHIRDIEDDAMELNPNGNWYKTMLDFPIPNIPGDKFFYNTGASCLLSVIISKNCKMLTHKFAEKYLFNPMGIVDYKWEKGPENIAVGGWGLYLKPIDMLKIGQLLLQNGNWEGQQIVSKQWVNEMTSKQIEVDYFGNGYGYHVWLNDIGGFRADGLKGQFIFVLPKYNSVIVFTADVDDIKIIHDFMKQYVLPSMIRK